MHKNGTVFKLNVKPTFSEIEGEIAGIFAGDGSQHFEPKAYHYEVNVHFAKQNIEYALYVKNIFETFFNKKFRLEKQNSNCLRLRTYSKEIYHFFENYLEYIPQVKHSTVKLKSNTFSTEFKIGFLRGMLDTDGCVRNLPHEKRTRIFFCTTSKELSIQIRNILNEFRINNGRYVSIRKYRNEKPVYYVNIWKYSADKFINLIKPLKAKARWAGS